MKGFILSPRAILVGVAIMLIFSNTIINLVGDIAWGVSGRGWDRLGRNVGATIFAADSRIKTAVEQIDTTKKLSGANITITTNDTDEPIPTDTFLKYTYGNVFIWRLQIILGVVAMFIYIWLLSKFFIWASHSSKIDLVGKLIAILAAIVILGIAQMGYTGFVQQDLQVPYIGVYTLITNPDALFGVIDYTEILPGNQTTGTIMNGTEPMSTNNTEGLL